MRFPPIGGLPRSPQPNCDSSSPCPSPVVGHGSGRSPQNPTSGCDERRDDLSDRLDGQAPHELLPIEAGRIRHLPDHLIRNTGSHAAVHESGNRAVRLRDQRQLIDPEPWVLVCQCSRRRYPGIDIALLPLPEHNEERFAEPLSVAGRRWSTRERLVPPMSGIALPWPKRTLPVTAPPNLQRFGAGRDSSVDVIFTTIAQRSLNVRGSEP